MTLAAIFILVSVWELGFSAGRGKRETGKAAAGQTEWKGALLRGRKAGTGKASAGQKGACVDVLAAKWRGKLLQGRNAS